MVELAKLRSMKHKQLPPPGQQIQKPPQVHQIASRTRSQTSQSLPPPQQIKKPPQVTSKNQPNQHPNPENLMASRNLEQEHIQNKKRVQSQPQYCSPGSMSHYSRLRKRQKYGRLPSDELPTAADEVNETLLNSTSPPQALQIPASRSTDDGVPAADEVSPILLPQDELNNEVPNVEPDSQVNGSHDSTPEGKYLT